MPLPSDPNTPWPPERWQPIQQDLNEAAVWYSGDETQLARYYAPATDTGFGAPWRRKQRKTGQAAPEARFWGRQQDASVLARIHVPVAGDIASTSADLLFGEELSLTLPEAHEADEAGEVPASAADAVAAEDRLGEIVEEDGWANKLLEAAEVAAGIGSVFLRPVWDLDLADHPMLDAVAGDQAVPERRWGRLTAVTFWRVVQVDGASIWRHLERYEPGRIMHGLYVGTWDAIGTPVSLAEHDATSWLTETGDGAGEIVLPDDLSSTVLAREIPNVKPNRQRRLDPVGAHQGRSDTAGVEATMDALDETISSWMRDIRLGKARIVVPDEFLDRGGRGQGASFDLDRQIFSPLSMDPSAMDKAGIHLIQPEIRQEPHARTVAELMERIVVASGYSPATFGLIGDTAVVQTATEVVAREGRTARTIARKQRYAAPAVADIAEMVMVIDRDIFGTQIEPVRPRVVWPAASDDPRRLAETVDLLARAQAASIEARVRMVQPHLDEPAVKQEVARITSEMGFDIPDPVGPTVNDAGEN